MLRLIRVVLALEGLVMSWKTYRATRELEVRRETGDQAVKDAVALTPQSHLFQVPNGLSASAYFVLMTVLCATRAADRRPFRPVTVALAWLSLGVSVYLVWQLLFVLRRNCPLCMRAHTLNLALTLAVTAPGANVAPKRR